MGFKGETGFNDLNSVVFPCFFALGIMHLIHKNTSELFISHWMPRPGKKGPKKKQTKRQRSNASARRRKSTTQGCTQSQADTATQGDDGEPDAAGEDDPTPYRMPMAD